MSFTKLTIVALTIAFVEARFGQEGLIQNEIQALSNFGEPGAAATLAGQSPGVLLAGAGPCAKLSLADDIVAQLGDDPAVIAAAISLVAAERNFNPSAVDTGDICADPSLPATAALRGILPLFDPAVDGSDIQNANSAASVVTPFDATGLSVAEVAIAQGFTNFNAVDAAGTAVDLAGLGAGAGAGNGAVVDDVADVVDDVADDVDDVDDVADEEEVVVVDDCAAVVIDDEEDDVDDEDDVDEEDDVDVEDDAAVGGGASDFGTCDPTIKFVGGLGGRPATEFTFQSNDAAIAANQQEALNPNIITNRICDELTNICGANDAAIATCKDAQAELLAQGAGPGSDGDLVVSTFNSLVLA